MLQERRCYDKGNWIVVRERDRVIVHRSNSNAAAHDFADKITDESNDYHYVDEEAGKYAFLCAAGFTVKGE